MPHSMTGKSIITDELRIGQAAKLSFSIIPAQNAVKDIVARNRLPESGTRQHK